MKKLSVLLALLTVGLMTGYAQCNNPFYRMEEGHHYEMETYNRKDKLQAQLSYTVTNVAETSNGYEATLASKTLDRKDKVISEGEVVVQCDEGTLKMDIQRLLSGIKQVQDTEGMEINIQGGN